MDELIKHARELRDKFLADPARPTYHFVVPEGYARPFDPNGCIFWKGKYHLMYIFQDRDLPHGGHCWGHASSVDMVHWTHHPASLVPNPGDPDVGIFSGNAFVNKEGEATILYHGVSVGNCIATSSDDDLLNWTKLPSNPIIPSPKEGDPEFGEYRSWDPHGWLDGDTYYGLFGGKRPSIFKATELDKWEYVGDLLAHAYPGVDINEDISCPDLFQMGGKYVLVCISHRLGCRYYVGEWKDEQFHPEFHEQMSWVDNAYFAPESLLDDKGRRIMWAWIFDGRNKETVEASGWSGTMSLPRVLWLGDDNTMRMAPPEELDSLRYNAKKIENLTVKADSELPLKDIGGNTIELDVEMTPHGAKQLGVKVCCSPDGEEQTAIYYDVTDKKLKVDTTKSSLGEGSKSVEAGPFELRPNERLKLRIYVDKSVVEVFANDRQAVMRRIYPTKADSLGVVLFSCGGAAEVKSVKAWNMAASTLII